jgi:hypothetical protein
MQFIMASFGRNSEVDMFVITEGDAIQARLGYNMVAIQKLPTGIASHIENNVGK